MCVSASVFMLQMCVCLCENKYTNLYISSLMISITENKSLMNMSAKKKQRALEKSKRRCHFLRSSLGKSFMIHIYFNQHLPLSRRASSLTWVYY